MPDLGPPPFPGLLRRPILAFLSVAISYALLARLSILFSFQTTRITTIFPAAGLALAAVLLIGRPALLGVWLGSAITLVISLAKGPLPSLPALLAGVVGGAGSMVGAGFGARLVQHLCGKEDPLASGRGVTILTSLGALVGSLISSSIGVVAMGVGGFLPWGHTAFAWLTWWIGDATGTILAAPLILAVFKLDAWHFEIRRALEALVSAAALALFAYAVFFRGWPVAYMIIPLLLWISLRLGMLGATSGGAAIALLATLGTTQGLGPFSRASAGESLILLHSFLGVTLFCALFLASTLDERQRLVRKGQAISSQLKAVLDTLPDLVWLKDPEGVYLTCNHRFEQFFGSDQSSICGKTDYDFVSHDLADFFREQDHRAVVAREPRSNEETVTFASDGHQEHLETVKSPFYGPQGELLGVLGIGRDISRRKRMELDLQLAKANFSSLIESTDDLIWSVDNRYRLVLWNSAYEKHIRHLYGKSVRLGETHFDRLPSDRAAKWTPFYDRAMTEGPFQCEYPIPNGGVLELAFNPIRNGDEVIGVSVFGKNITQRKEAEGVQASLQAQLIHSQKMEGLGSLAGGLAHDLNNVLGAILGMASAHLSSAPENSPIRHALSTIALAAERGGKVIRSLLNFARRTPAEEEEVNLNEVLLDQTQILERTTFSRIHVALDLAPDVGPIRGDPSALALLFLNLCLNAVDAMAAEGGTLTLRSRNLDNEWVDIQIEDTGHGMTQEVLARATEPFFTTKPLGKGTGLGLAMAYSTVKAHKGEWEIRSGPGQGTTVRMRFPACPAAKTEASTEVRRRPDGTAHSLKVLLVDDDDLLRESIQEVLQALKHSPRPVSSGEEALALIESGWVPDVVILDMNMPGLGGVGTLPRLRTLLPNVPVLLATGRVDQTALDLQEAFPFVHLLGKPFSLDELRNRLGNLATDA